MISLKEVCLQLDKTVIDFFETLDNILSSKAELEAVLRDGYFLMAKARYSMGTKAVGSLQYNEDDLRAALCHVDVTSDGSSRSYELTHDNDKPIAMRKEEDEGEKGEIRKRKGPDVVKEDEVVNSLEQSLDSLDLQKDCGYQSASTKSKSLSRDPIKWFGILVPQSLRQCQGKFKDATRLTCTLASLQSRLAQLRNDYQTLLLQKHKLLTDDILDLEEF